jgi:chemosensory pili system protein ChpA (sensor histidine kinase/response regulator)
MPSAAINSFLENAEAALRSLRALVLVQVQEGGFADLHSEMTVVSGLRREAAELDLWPAAFVLGAVEEDISAVRQANDGKPEAWRMLALLDSLAHAEAEIVKAGFAGDDRIFDESDLSALHFGLPEEEPLPGAGDAVVDLGCEDDTFDPDPEMLEIFAVEAEELLDGIEQNLEILAANPADGDALWEVRRRAHTFKGAAGIIGLKEPSRLAHRIEDLLDQISQGVVAPDPRSVALISSAASLLRSMTDGDGQDDPGARLPAIYAEFEQALNGSGPKDPKKTPPATESERPKCNEPAAAPAPAPAAEPPRPIVRVSLDRLDDLGKTVRDMLVNRPSIERRLAEFNDLLESLGQAARTLQTASARIESQFEAAMLASSPQTLMRIQGINDVSDPGADDHNSFDALEFDRYTDFHESSRRLSESAQDFFAIGGALENLKASIETILDDQRKLIDETQSKLVQIRMIRFDAIATRLQRAVRVTCEESGKTAEIVIENPDVEVDTDVMDSLVEPVMHIIRNAVVHGIETPETRRLVGKPECGRITVAAADHETHLEIRISDDGRGISRQALLAKAQSSGLVPEGGTDPAELLSLMCLPGLTTAEKLTMSAGRGVGMSIARESIESRGGTISVETAPQKGTTFVITIPVTFAVTRSLIVRSGDRVAAVPARAVKHIRDLETEKPDGPLRALNAFFPELPGSAESGSALQIEHGTNRYTLVVDEVLRTEELPVKRLGEPLDKVPGLLGVSLAGNGEIIPVLDLSFVPPAGPEIRREVKHQAAERSVRKILIVDDSPSVRHVTSKVISAAGWEPVSARDGVEALELLSSANDFEVILTDIEMPRMDGYQLAESLSTSESLSGIPVVFVTSRVGEKHREKAAELGVTEYLTKPFNERELRGVVDRLASARSALATSPEACLA